MTAPPNEEFPGNAGTGRQDSDADSEEVTALITLAETSVGEDALDDDVHDAASRIGSGVNNDGIAAQVRFLVEECGADAARELVEQAARRGEEP